MKSAIVLALALAGSPAADAQAICEDIKSLVDLAFEDFQSIKGKQTVYDARSYVAAIALPRADNCVVRGAFTTTYECAWTFASLDTLAAAHESQLATISACLPDWQIVIEKKKTDELGDTEFTTFGATLRGNDRYESVSIKSWGVETVKQGVAFRVLRFKISSNEARPKVA